MTDQDQVPSEEPVVEAATPVDEAAKVEATEEPVVEVAAPDPVSEAPEPPEVETLPEEPAPVNQNALRGVPAGPAPHPRTVHHHKH